MWILCVDLWNRCCAIFVLICDFFLSLFGGVGGGGVEGDGREWEWEGVLHQIASVLRCG